MKSTPLRLAVLASLLAMTSACKNKRDTEPDGTTDKPTAAATAAPQATMTAQPKPPEPPQLPAPADVAAPPAGAGKSASGLAWTILTPGTGKEKPSPEDRVVVHYSGWTKDGKMFDSSVMRGQPATFALNQVIPGWTEGVQLMTEGSKVRFWIPGKLAYGDEPQRPGAPAGQLTFDVELLAIQ